MKEFERLVDAIAEPPISERISKAKTDIQLLRVLRKDGLVRRTEDYEPAKAPRDAFSQADLDAYVAKLSGIINQGQASPNLPQLIDKRLKKSRKIQSDSKDALTRARKHPEEYSYQEAFNHSVLPVFVQVIEKVDTPHGFLFLQGMLKNEFSCPGGLINRVAYRKSEAVQSKEELVVCDIDIEDLIYRRKYPLAEAAKISLAKVRQNPSIKGGLYFSN